MAVGNWKHLDTKKIESEIEKFESKVDFEFIPVIAGQSSSTEHVPWVLSLGLILLLTIPGEMILNHFLYDTWYDKTAFYLCVFISSMVLTNVLSRFDAVKRLFISEKERNRQVHDKAQALFFTKRLDHIQSQNALMVFISVMEHRIEIIPDPQIKMNGLQEITDRCVFILRDDFKKKDYESGLISMIQYIQKQLEEKFPRKQSGENVVSNKITFLNF